MTRLRRIGRVTGPLIIALLLVVAALPRVARLRCLMMGTVVASPCCPVADDDGAGGEPRSDRLLDGDCFEHIPGGVPTIKAVRAATDHRLTPTPLPAVVLWAAPAAPLVSPLDWDHVDAGSGSPPERRLRVPTVLLRV